MFQNYVIRSQRRDELTAYLKEQGIETLFSWPIPMHRQQALNLGHFALPQTEALSREVLTLRIYPEMTNEYVAAVVQVVRKGLGSQETAKRNLG